MTDLERTIIVSGVGKAYTPRERGRLLAEVLARRFTGGKAPAPPLRWALRDVSFQLTPGESLGVIGRNGAGKSTLLKILAGIAHPTTGSVHVPMRVSTQLGLGAGFSPHLTGEENVLLQGTVLGLTNREVRRLLPAIVAFAELEHAIKRPLWTYSSGMSARLAFAIAAHAHAELMLIDEALSAGDASFHERCRRSLEEARREGRTLVVVSHSTSSIKALCDRALWLEQGVVQDLGPTEQVLPAYLAATVKGK